MTTRHRAEWKTTRIEKAEQAGRAFGVGSVARLVNAY